MRPTKERLRRAVSEIEVRLDLLKNRKEVNPNIDAAIAILETLREEISLPDETPVDLLGVCADISERLEEIGIETIEQLERIKLDSLRNVPRIGVERLSEIEGALEVWRDWGWEADLI